MGTSAMDVYKEIAKESNKTQKELQQMADKTTAKTFEYNTKEAEKSRKWQKQMSDTAHQREVKDLKKAGLNPVLSANSGAASYTTSSASAEAENPASAVANLEASKLSSVASLQGSQISAEAMKESARTSAAATLAAAEAAAEAARYKADKDAEVKKYVVDKQYEIAMDKPVSNPWALADKYLTKAGFTDGVVNAVAKIANNIKKNASSMFSGKKAAKNNFNLDKQGLIAAGDGLEKLGFPKTSKLANKWVDAFVFGDQKALNYFELCGGAIQRAKANGYGKTEVRKFHSYYKDGRIAKTYYLPAVQVGKNKWEPLN